MRSKTLRVLGVGAALLLLLSVSAGADCLTVSTPDSVDASPGDFVDAPISITPGLDTAGVIGFLIVLNFDATHLQFQEVRDCVGGVVFPSSDWKPFTFNVIGNELRVAASGVLPLAGQGCFLVVRFRVSNLSPPSTCSAIHLTSVIFNAGTPCATLIDGSVCTACR